MPEITKNHQTPDLIMKVQTFEGLQQELKLHFTKYRTCEVDVTTPANSIVCIRTERFADFIISPGIYQTQDELLRLRPGGKNP